MLVRFQAPALVWAGFILLISLLPGKDLPELTFWDFMAFDKVVHISAYAVFVFLMRVGFKKQNTFPKLRYRSAIISFGICFAYGILMEGLQEWLLRDRFFDMYDLFANAVGCTLGIIIFNFVYYKV